MHEFANDAMTRTCPFQMPISSSLPRNSRTYAILYTINEIRPYLYICGYGAVNEQKLKELGITHIVDCTNIPSRRRIPGIEYFHVCVEDSEAANIAQYFEAATTFMKKAKDKVNMPPCELRIDAAQTVNLSEGKIPRNLDCHDMSNFHCQSAAVSVLSRHLVSKMNFLEDSSNDIALA